MSGYYHTAPSKRGSVPPVGCPTSEAGSIVQLDSTSTSEEMHQAAPHKAGDTHRGIRMLKSSPNHKHKR
eukprot:4546212-Alexandrium_andersonii.AAC.1